MSLIRNGNSLGSNNLRLRAGANLYTVQRSRWTGPGAMRGIYCGDGTAGGAARTAGRPNGAEGHYAWSQPMRGGGLAAYTSIDHGHEMEGGLAQGVALAADLVSDSEVEAALSSVVGLLSEMVSAGEIDASLQSIAALAATLVADGQAEAGLSALANLAVELEALGGLENSNLRGTLSMAADLTTEGSVETLTAAAVARAVWDEALASHTDDGSAGDTLARVSKIVKAVLGLSA